jgi:hypothetical protein
MPPSPMNHLNHCKLPLAAPAQSVPMKSKVFPWPMSSNVWLKVARTQRVKVGLLSSPLSPEPSGPLSDV